MVGDMRRGDCESLIFSNYITVPNPSNTVTSTLGGQSARCLSGINGGLITVWSLLSVDRLLWRRRNEDL